MSVSKSEQAVHDYIGARSSEYLEAARRLIRQPSVSATGEGIEGCTKIVLDNLKELQCETAKIVTTKHHPIVYGELHSSNDRAKSIIFYSMYDVQPAEPLGEWKVPPFSGEVIELGEYGPCIVSRGANNTKCPMIQALKGIEAIKKVTGDVPVNFYFVIEGEEEIGSPSLKPFLAEYGERMKAVDVAWINLEANRPRTRTIRLGFKGVCLVEMECKGGQWGGPTKGDIHSRHAAWVNSPIWRLVMALSTLKDGKEQRILIDGFYDELTPLTEGDLESVRQLASKVDMAEVNKETGVLTYKNQGSRPKEELLRDYIFEPTLNIQSLHGGFEGGEFKTIVPYRATVRLDMRLLPAMRPEDMHQKLRKHLDKNGFADIAFTNSTGYLPMRTPLSHPFARACLQTMEKQTDMASEVWPLWPGSAPFSFFAEPPLAASVVSSGFSFGGRNHAPNEFHRISGFNEGIKLVSSMLLTYGQLSHA